MLTRAIRGPMIDAGELNCGTVFKAPFGSPFTRRPIVPVSVLTCQTVAAFVTLLMSNATLNAWLLKLKFLPARRSSVVSAGSRSLFSGSTLIVVAPPIVVGALSCRLKGVPLCDLKFAANRMSYGNRVRARQLELHGNVG